MAGTPSAVTRRLAAIVIADVVGYTRLMERDDAGTFARLRSIRDEVVDASIASHGGRIVKTAGDGLLAEFPSALAALRASIEIQRQMAARNDGQAADARIDYRIGINLGDIMVDGDDIAGDGVNVASRLESLAEPGGICVASGVREQGAWPARCPMDRWRRAIGQEHRTTDPHLSRGVDEQRLVSSGAWRCSARAASKPARMVGGVERRVADCDRRSLVARAR
jgi:class 3 adenylate cyclase